MSHDQADKIHPPTPQRREQARQQGQVAKSQDLVSAGLLTAGILALQLTGNQLVEFFERLARRQWGGTAWLRLDADLAVEQWQRLAGELFVALAPLLGFLLAISVLAHLGQTGWLFLPEKLAWDPGRLNPVGGFSRLFEPSNAARVGMGLAKMVLVVLVAAGSLWSDRHGLLALAGKETAGIAVGLMRCLLWIGLKASLVLLVLALVDYAWQRWRHEQDLRMTPQELREELQAQQGDPRVRSRLRQLQQVSPPAATGADAPGYSVPGYSVPGYSQSGSGSRGQGGA